MIKNDQHRGKLQHCSLLPVQHKLFPSWNVSSNKHYYFTNTVSRRQLTGPLCNVVKQHHLEVALRMTHDIFQWMCLFFSTFVCIECLYNGHTEVRQQIQEVLLYLQLKDVRGQLSQTVFREVDLLQVSSPEYWDGVWKTLDFIGGGFALPLHGGRERELVLLPVSMKSSV